MKPRNLPVAAQNLSLLSGLGAVLFAWAAVALWHSLPGPWSLAALPLAHTAAAAVVISVAATERLSQRTIGLFGKRTDGSLQWGRALLLLPFHATLFVVWRGYRALTSEPHASKICEGIYLGGCPATPADLPPGAPPALLDVTAEMRRCVEAPAYKALYCWETHGLPPERLEEGVRWALEQRAAGRAVLTYCTHGHSRSAMVVCALVIAAGAARDPAEARRLVARGRPAVRPNRRQEAALEDWYVTYGKERQR